MEFKPVITLRVQYGLQIQYTVEFKDEGQEQLKCTEAYLISGGSAATAHFL